MSICEQKKISQKIKKIEPTRKITFGVKVGILYCPDSVCFLDNLKYFGFLFPRIFSQIIDWIMRTIPKNVKQYFVPEKSRR
jgi:hypothetical protein